MTHRIKSIEDVQAALRKSLRGKQLVWLGARGLDAAGMDELVDDKVLVCCADEGLEFPLHTHLDFVSMQNGVRHNAHTKDYVDWFEQLLCKNRWKQEVVLLPYQSTQRLERICSKYQIKLLATPTVAKQQFSNKLILTNLVTQLGLPQLRSGKVAVSGLNYSCLSHQISPAIVIQSPTGSGGEGTFLVTSDLELNQVQQWLEAHAVTEVLIAPYTPGISPNLNAVVTKFGTIVATPSYQIIGVPECGAERFSFNGNQWPISGQEFAVELGSQMALLGRYMYTSGYRGICGADFQQHYLVEINDRVNNGTQAFTQLCLEQNVIPPIAFHILELLDVDYDFDIVEYNQQLQSLQLSAFQLVIHNIETENIVITGQLDPGVYLLETEGLKYLRPGTSITDAEQGEFVITGGVPRIGLYIEPGATILKIQGRGNIYSPESQQLTPHGVQIVKAVKQQLGIAKE